MQNQPQTREQKRAQFSESPKAKNKTTPVLIAVALVVVAVAAYFVISTSNDKPATTTVTNSAGAGTERNQRHKNPDLGFEQQSEVLRLQAGRQQADALLRSQKLGRRISRRARCLRYVLSREERLSSGRRRHDMQQLRAAFSFGEDQRSSRRLQSRRAAAHRRRRFTGNQSE